MKFNKKHSFLPLALVGIMSLGSCSWDTISRAQAIQILKGIELYREEIPFVIPQNKTISLELSHEFFNVDISMFQKFQTYTKIVIVPYAAHADEYVLYRKTYEGLGDNVFHSYREEYHYLSEDNNTLFSKVKNVYDKNVPWECNEIRNTHQNSSAALNAYFELQNNFMNQFASLVYGIDQIGLYVTLLEILGSQNDESISDSINLSSLDVTDVYRSLSFRSVSADVTIHGHKLDGERFDDSWFSFSYSDEQLEGVPVLQYYKYKDYYTSQRAEYSFEVDYDSYIYIPDDDIFCEESEESEESESSEVIEPMN